jgi:hypothetical protein
MMTSERSPQLSLVFLKASSSRREMLVKSRFCCGRSKAVAHGRKVSGEEVMYMYSRI